MTTECRCGRPTRDDAYVCDQCSDDLGGALGDVPWLDEQLEITITGQRAATYDGAPSRGAERPSPVHWGASEARAHLRALLVSWTLFCDAEGVRSTDPRPGLPADNLPALSRWLLWRVDGLTLHDIGPEAVDEITSAVVHCRRVIDRREVPRYVGTCDECDSDLYETSGRATCRRCGAEYDLETLRRRMESALVGRLVTAREGATLLSRFGLETGQGTIDKWHERGKVIGAGSNGRGHRLYRWEELLALAIRAAEKVGA